MKFRSKRSAYANGNRRLAEILKSQNGCVHFTGELMTCVLCGRTEQSDVNVSKGWRCW